MKPGEPQDLRASCFWLPENANEIEDDDECIDDQAGVASVAPRAADEVEAKGLGVRALRAGAAARIAAADGQRARALRVRGEERGARVVDVVATGDFAGCARPA